VRRPLVPIVLLALTGCAYFNGVYNANRAAKRADGQWTRGEYTVAADSFRVSAAHAETVLVRFPKSRWRNEALYLAARGAAFSDNCALARPRLASYLGLEGEPQIRRDRARVAAAVCLIAEGKSLPADSLLRPLLTHEDRAIRYAAALYSARVALALGDPDRAQDLLATIPGDAAAWENVDASFAAGDYAAAESLLIRRAQAGDWRSEVPNRVRTLWSAGRVEGATAVALQYARSRVSTNQRAQLLLLASDLAADGADTLQARRLALEARRVGLTVAFEGPVAARLLALRLRGTSEMADVRIALERDSVAARGTPLLERMTMAVLLIELCLKRADRFGAGIFLGAEIARDSLRAPRLAHTLFKLVEQDHPESPIAARALVAAGQLQPDSAAAYAARAVAAWPTAGVSARLRGLSPRDSSTQVGEDNALNQSWIVVMNQFADTLRSLARVDSIRRADSVAAILRARGRGL
jgi:hypothetical protein